MNAAIPEPMLADLSLDLRLRQFLYREADLLDRWQLREWLDLFTDDAVYLVPTTDHPSPQPDSDLTLIHDERHRLAYRVDLLLGGRAWAEQPASRTRREITNVMLVDRRDATLDVQSNFTIRRFRHGDMQTFVGHYRHRLVDCDGILRIRHRTAVLDHETLTPHGMVSIIL
ncbi:aromatic-ring-hydroxylating dioxygenase subunit beta [Burkholderia cepacia]|uniref:aromatic-ring-hydroxylating dioxygenase subunit beta n=1 Tax=Burkholderia cepacia TaxID=292 RepID=UPI000A9FBA5B|nr:aromatic-ring-hydroxylating dioxygenase subunit beta [Burkholderia cepacia]